MLDKNFDYTPMLGRNILNLGKNAKCELVEKEPFEAPPKDDKGYRLYKEHYEKIMGDAQRAQGLETDEGFIKISAACEYKDEKLRPILTRAKQKPEHMGSNFCFSCDHVQHTDPVSPEVIRFIPFQRGFPEGYFICDTCFKLMEKKKFDLFRKLHSKCSLCIAENLSEIIKIHPDRFIDMSRL